jgi:hypothetical protein
MHNDIQPTAAPTGPALTPLQDLFCDLAGDPIARGAPDWISRGFVRSLSLYSAFLNVAHWPGGATEAAVTSSANLRGANWHSDLVRSWPTSSRIETKGAAVDLASESATVAVRALERVRLVSLLEEFLGGATPEEVRITARVMSNWSSLSSGNGGIDECPLLCELAAALRDADQRFFVAPERHQKAAHEFLDLLERRESQALRAA